MLLTHGVCVCYASSGHCSGYHSVWTVVMTLKLFVADVDRLRGEFRLIVADLCGNQSKISKVIDDKFIINLF